ncbi:cephalotocin receptor 1-like [Haliotis cracherodii]|uniref:cephalotocin receptor 1-like n=1 Tax=Haliotis cracherodii TaxID=6455 RepID=UPI0039EC59BF
MDMDYGNNFTDYTYDYDSDLTTPSNTTEIVVSSVLLYIGVCTNIWMIRSLYKSWKTGNRMYFYLLVICIADGLGLCIRSGISIGSYATVFWKGGYYGCKIVSGFQMFGPTVSHLILAGFNIDNLFTITCSRSIKALRIVFLLCSLVVSFIMCGLKFYYYRLVAIGQIREAYFCVVDPEASISLLLSLVDVAVYFLLPLLIMILLGLPSLFVWCYKKGTIAYKKMTRDDGSCTDLQFLGRDIGIVLAYDVVFFLCCAPFVVFSWGVGSFHTWNSFIVYTALLFLETANACLNPFIYAIFNCIGRRRETSSPGL